MKDFLKKTFTKENMKKFYFSFIWLMVLIFAIDIITKWAVVGHFGVEAMTTGIGVRDPEDMISVIPGFLYIGGAINPNAAFSLGFSSNEFTNRIIFVCISVILSAVLIIYYVKCYKSLSTWLKVGLALMISGAIGNLIDRAFYWPKTVGFSGVIDWIQVIFSNGVPFATFNIADSALVVGVFVLIIVFIVDEVKESIQKAKEGEYKYSPKEREEMKKNETRKGK